MEFLKLNYTALPGMKWGSAGLLDQGKVSQNRVKEGKKSSWDKKQ